MKKEEIVKLFPIETARLRIRVATLNDNHLIQDAKVSNDKTLRYWMSWSDDEGMSMLGTINYLNMVNSEKNKRNIAVLAVDKYTGEHVLSSGLDAEDDDFQVISTGWWLSHGHEGKGLASEGMTALIDLCRTQTDMQKMTASHYEGNSRSGKLMERLGFEHIVTTHKTHQCHLDGEMMDEYEFELEFRK